METLRKRKSTPEIIFLFAYAIYILYKAIRNSTLNDLLSIPTINGLRIISFLMCILSIIIRIKIPKKIFVRSVILFCISGVVYFFCGTIDIVAVFLILIAAYSIEFEYVLNTCLYTNIIVTSMIILLSLFKVLPNYTYARYSIFGTIVQANSFGFTYYSTVSFIIVYISLMLLYKYYNLVTVLALFGLNVFIYFKTTTRMPLLIFLIAVVVSFGFKKNISGLVKRKKFWKITPLMGMLMSVLFSLLYPLHINIIDIIDTLLVDRIHFSYRGLSEYGVKIFGNKIPMVGAAALNYGTSQNVGVWQYFYIDNSYIYILLVYGLLITAFVIWGYCKLMDYSIDNRLYFLSAWIFVSLIFAFINNNLLIIEYNVLPIFAIKILMGNFDKKIDNRIIKKMER